MTDPSRLGRQMTVRTARGITRLPLERVAHLAFGDLHPLRQPARAHHQPQRPVLHFSQKSGRHVGCRSQLAWGVVLSLDFDPQVMSMVSEPLAHHLDARTSKAYSPDLAVLMASGEIRIVDIVSPARADKAHVKRSLRHLKESLAQVGWGHQALGPVDPQRLTNLRWLSGFRRSNPVIDALKPGLLEACAEPRALGALAAEHGRALALPAIWGLIWARRLECDLDGPIGERTLLRRAA